MAKVICFKTREVLADLPYVETPRVARLIPVQAPADSMPCQFGIIARDRVEGQQILGKTQARLENRLPPLRRIR